LKRKKKTLLWILGTLGALFVLLFGLLLLAPSLINTETVREKVLAAFSENLDGQVEYKKIDLSFLPRPRLVLNKVSLSIPGKITGTLKSLTLYPEILPFLKGNVRFSEIHVNAPDFKLSQPARPKSDKKGETGFSSAVFSEKLSSIVAVMVSKAPGLLIKIEEGKLGLLENKGPGVRFQNISGRITLPPNMLDVEITCSSNLLETLSFKGSLDSGSLKSKGTIALNRFRPELMTGLIFPQAPIHLSDSEMNLTVGFKADGLKTIEADLEATLPRMAFSRDKRKLTIKKASVKGTFSWDGEETRILLTRLDTDYPRIKTTGKIQIKQAEPRVSLDLEGKDIDVNSLRKAALSIAGDISVIHEIFSIVKGGQVPLITLNTAGNSPASIGELKNISIKGRLVDGQIFVPKAQLDLKAVGGEVSIIKGVLAGKGLTTKFGNTLGSQGILQLGLLGDSGPFHLDIMLKADLSEIPPVLKRLSENKTLLREIDLIKELNGNATARLILGENTKSIKPRVTVTKLDVSAKYGRLPYPVVITNGQLVFEGTSLAVKDFSGNLGNSNFSKLSSRFDWKRDSFVEVTAGAFDISLNEIYPWISSFDGVGGRLKELKDVKGRLRFSSIRLKGPVSTPQDWDLQVVGEASQVSVGVVSLGESAELTRARFDATEKNISFQDAHINILDASLKVSGGLNDYLKDLSKVEMEFDGDVKPEAIRRFSGLVDMPSYLKLPSSLSISNSHFVWKKGGMISFNGDVDINKGSKISLDIVHKNGNLGVKKLSVTDKKSNAVLGFDLNKKEISAKFSGNLERETLEPFLKDKQFLPGSIRGDFYVKAERDNLVNFVAEGTLNGTNLTLPWEVGGPLKVEGFSVSAKENRILFEPVTIKWGDARLVFKGKAGFGKNKIRLDMDLLSDGLDVEKLIGLAPKKEVSSGGASEKSAAWDLPFLGGLRVKANTMKYQKFTVQPLHANFSFEPDAISVSGIKANLCGISINGTLKISQEAFQLDFRSVAKGQKLNPAIICLTDKSRDMDGTFDFEGKITGKGIGHDLTRSLKGSFEFVAKDGQIYQDKAVARILAVLNVTEIFKGKLPALTEKGLAYNSITIAGRFEDGKLFLKQVVMDGTTLDLAGHGDIDLFEKKMDLIFLASFLKTADSIIRMIPLVRYIMDGTFVSVPIKISGDFGDPDVQYVSASAVGSSLLGMVERTFKLPVKVIEPILPKKEETQIKSKD